jgi:hypothetical protein
MAGVDDVVVTVSDMIPVIVGVTLTWNGLSSITGPFVRAGITAGVKLTIPVKPFMLVTKTVPEADWPAVTVMRLGALMLKLGGTCCVDDT